MYLKKLDILGFKSFANKTTVNFSEGLTSIVGPNGCGKTNILDALRWVLGEQKVSLLRGSKMEEVIFNGTREKKPLGMAEVTLTVINDRGVLPTEYNEVQITRRLFRSGESEYLLNKVPCRLKDITELFVDTGMGAHSYSVIQQDMIDAVISDKAEERRFLFEEAAGITKYKHRKRAALRKLDATEQDLLRLQDIYSEVKTQVNSLKRQYKKAERYQNVKNEIKGWELFLASNQIKELNQEKRALQAEAEDYSNRTIKKDTEIDQKSAELEALRKEQIDLEHVLSGVGEEAYQITENAHSIENRISVLQEKKSNNSLLVERNIDEIRALNGRAEILKEQTNEAKAEIDIATLKYQEITEQYKEADSQQSESDNKLLNIKESKESHNQKLLSLEGKLSSGKTEEDSLKEQVLEIQKQIGELHTQVSENESEKEKLNVKLEAASTELEFETAKKVRLGETKTNIISEQEKLKEKEDDIIGEISQLSASVEACQARKNLLEDMILHFEGHQSGVVTIMESRELWDGVAGTVAETFVPEDGLEIALEAALGEIAGFLICENRPTAENIISYLKSNNKGRIGILLPDSGTFNPTFKRPEINDENFVGWLDNFVKTEEKLQPLMHSVLSRIAVIKNEIPSPEILERLPYGFRVVSLSGKVYANNLISGGSVDSFPLFRRKEKVQEQDKIIVELTVQLEEKEAEKNKTAALSAEMKAAFGRITDEIESNAEEIISMQKNVDEINFQMRTVESEIQRLNNEQKTSSDKTEKIQHRQYSLGLDYSQLKETREDLMNRLNLSKKELDELELENTAFTEKVSKLQVQQVETKSKVEQLEHKISHQNELANEINRTSQQKKDEIVTAKKEIVNGEEAMAQMEIQLKEIFENRKVVLEKQTELKSRQSDILNQSTDQEKTVKQLRTEKEDFNQSFHKREIRLTTIESETKSISEKILEEYELNISVMELSKPDSEMTLDEAKTFLSEKKDLIKKFGAVNLLALEEYDSANKREKFLSENLEDLIKAKKDLETTISKINHTAKELFNDTFKKVEVNFKKLFIDLFSGGDADLRLEDPSDPLESNIEIIARPRGKKLLSITMMSGGERALTAISLLFALYMVKPSPYCILDEIDAPLDDANCHRYLNMIKRFANQTQFIAITHNKITMEAATNLYGVTMEEPGISKLVGVKFNEVDESQDSNGNRISKELIAIPSKDEYQEQNLEAEEVETAVATDSRMSLNVASENSDNES